MRSICVFCGSSSGLSPIFREMAITLGTAIARNNLRLVYGGGHVGLMGVVADATLNAGGEVLGVIPRALDEKEIGHRGLTELRITGSMHERKAMMAEEADGFIALPGGFGTLDELCEILTWAQLGIHHKPIGLLNVEGFFDSLLGFFDEATAKGFIRESHRRILLEDADIETLIERMEGWTAVEAEVSKWDEPALTPAP